MQKFGLRGNARSLAAMILNVADGELMWIDANLATRGYGHAVGRERCPTRPARRRPVGTLQRRQPDHRARRRRLARRRPSRPDRGRPPERHRHAHRALTIPRRPSPRSAPRRRRTVPEAASPAPASSVFAATTDPERLTAIAGNDVTEGSLAMLLDGRAPAPWNTVNPADLAAGLVPAEPASISAT
jgi:hypothetical protein